MNKHWHFYHADSGLFSTVTFAGPPASLQANTPRGLVAIEGYYNVTCQRVDTASGNVVDYEPPPPDGNHEWNARFRCHVKTPAALAREAALAEIEALEIKQRRPLRELALNPADAEARARVAAIEAQIAELRESL